ncbi:MAG: FAD-dependent oxidoreductase, partial [Erysipelotrichaceae bacterium]|nr:FAD-dependent oxidoreductase [Erysipelotrichaceae bacterium]
MKKTVIIGGVAGGASCAARLRRLDEEAEIIMLERGDYISFANCGLPYHVGGAIPDKGDLLLMTPELMKKRFNIDVRVRHEVTDIDPSRKTVTIRDLSAGKEYEETYDDLVIATGSSPIRPKIDGINSEYIRTVNNVNETVLLRNEIRDDTVERVAVIGGGFIGLEMADNLLEAGKKVTIIEAADQLMRPLDKEMSLILNKHLKKKGIDLILNDGVSSFKENEKNISVFLKSGNELSFDLVILSIGVKPNSEFAIKAGIKVNERGGIVVDEYMRTSLPHIYAAGDVCEVENFVSHEKAMIPLAGPANKQGRLVAGNIAGDPRPFKGSQGTSIAKICDLSAGSSGLNEKDLKAKGLKRGSDYETVTISANSHATYYPGARPMMAKLIFDKKTLKILGIQIVGEEG